MACKNLIYFFLYNFFFIYCYYFEFICKNFFLFKYINKIQNKINPGFIIKLTATKYLLYICNSKPVLGGILNYLVKVRFPFTQVF